MGLVFYGVVDIVHISERTGSGSNLLIFLNVAWNTHDTLVTFDTGNRVTRGSGLALIKAWNLCYTLHGSI